MSDVDQSFIDTDNYSTNAVTKFIESPAYKELLKQINYINKVHQEILIILGPQMRRIMEIYQEMVERILPFIAEINRETAQTFTAIQEVSIPSSPIIEDDIVPRAPPLENKVIYNNCTFIETQYISDSKESEWRYWLPITIEIAIFIIGLLLGSAQ